MSARHRVGRCYRGDGSAVLGHRNGRRAAAAVRRDGGRLVEEVAGCNRAIGELEQFRVAHEVHPVGGAGTGVGDVEGAIQVLGDRVVCPVAREDRRVVSIAAVEEVVPTVADEDVITSDARQNVGIAIADQRVVEVAAPQILNGDVGIACSFSRVQGRVGQIGHEPDLRGPKLIVSRIAAAAAIESVPASATSKEVVRTIADQCVAEVAASDTLDRGVRVTGSLARIVGGIGEAHRHPNRRTEVGGIVDPIPTVDGVCPQTARNEIGGTVSDQRIAEIAADEALDGDEKRLPQPRRY